MIFTFEIEDEEQALRALEAITTTLGYQESVGVVDENNNALGTWVPNPQTRLEFLQDRTKSFVILQTHAYETQQHLEQAAREIEPLAL